MEHDKQRKQYSNQVIEAAWRIWKSEVTSDGRMPIQSVTQIAEHIDSVLYPRDHICALHQDLIGQCMICGKIVD